MQSATLGAPPATPPVQPATAQAPSAAPDAVALREVVRVLEVRSADGKTLAPPEIAERFQGRTFTLPELEARGVRITSRQGWYLSAGQDWHLQLGPAV